MSGDGDDIIDDGDDVSDDGDDVSDGGDDDVEWEEMISVMMLMMMWKRRSGCL